jgi:1,4-dihydroxy-2-naphthoate octaprenyltransferase
MAEHLTWEVAIGSLGISALVAAILHVNDLRDFDSDLTAGKRTLAHLLGKANAVREYVVLIAAAYVFTAILIVIWPSNWPVLIAAASLPAAIAMIRLVRRKDDPQLLNLGVRGTAKLHFQFGLLMTFGLLIRSVIERLD